MAIGNSTTNAFTAEELATEIFESIPGWEGYYSASTLGRIRRDKASSGTRIGHILKGRPIKKGGHLQVSLFRDPSQAVYCYIHQLVLLTFEGPCPDGFETSHEDGDPANNRRGNISYKPKGKHREFDADHFGARRGERQSKAKLTDVLVTSMREKYKEGRSITALAREYKIHPSSLYEALHGETWRHVTGSVEARTGHTYHHKLTNQAVLDIVRLLDAGTSQTEIAQRFNISRPIISQINSGKKWGDLTGRSIKDAKRRKEAFRHKNQSKGYRYGEKHPQSKLSDQQVAEIRELYKTGQFSLRDLAKRFWVSRSNISYIVNNKSRPTT